VRAKQSLGQLHFRIPFEQGPDATEKQGGPSRGGKNGLERNQRAKGMRGAFGRLSICGETLVEGGHEQDTGSKTQPSEWLGSINEGGEGDRSTDLHDSLWAIGQHGCEDIY